MNSIIEMSSCVNCSNNYSGTIIEKYPVSGS
jgi:hypothetical protein